MYLLNVRAVWGSNGPASARWLDENRVNQLLLDNIRPRRTVLSAFSRWVFFFTIWRSCCSYPLLLYRNGISTLRDTADTRQQRWTLEYVGSRLAELPHEGGIKSLSYLVWSCPVPWTSLRLLRKFNRLTHERHSSLFLATLKGMSWSESYRDGTQHMKQPIASMAYAAVKEICLT